jgi:phage gp29-like protein
MVYSAVDGVFAPYEFHLIHQRYFEYERKTRTLSFRESSTVKTDPSANSDKFILHYHKSDGGELVDYGIMGQIIFTALLKHATINANMQYFETLGVPPVIVKIDSSSEDELKSILNQVMSLRSNSIGMFPQNAVVDLLEGKASKTEFLDFIRYCDSVMSHYIIGATLAGGKDQTGSFALGKVHDERRKDIMRLDARLLQKPINDLLKRILALNTPTPKPFTFEFDIGDETDEKLLSEVYKNLSDAGYDIPPEHIGKMFSIDGVERKSDTSAPKAQNTKEKNSKSSTPFRIEDQAAAIDTKKLEKNIAQQLEAILEDAEDYDTAMSALIEAFPEFDFDTLSTMLEEYSLKSTIVGAAEVVSGG